MRFRWGWAVASFVLASVAWPAGAAHQPAVELFRFRDARIAESSGVATASYRNDLIFTHNDSGDGPRFFAVDFTGATVATYTVAGATAVDWEDMARGPHQDGTPGQSLYFGDIGNNLRDRGVMTIYEVNEPVVGITGATVPLRSVIRFKYPDIRRDAEALLVHPQTGALVIVAKEFHGLSNVYVRPRGGGAFQHVATLNMLKRMSPKLKAIVSGGGPLSGAQVTGGAIGPAGDRIVLRTYLEAHEWPLYGSDYARSFGAKSARVPVPRVMQGESATYVNDGTSFLTTTEGVGGPVHRMQSTFAH